MKENDGRGARKRALLKVVVGGLMILMVLEIGRRLTTSIQTRKTRHRRIYMEQHRRSDSEVQQQILDGNLHLVDIRIQSLEEITAVFCELDWSLQARDPSVVPMFRDLKEQSRGCVRSAEVRVDFHKVVRLAKEYDDQRKIPRASPTAVAFHETRCGSTLLANLLSATSPQARVYSESKPALDALQACSRLSRSTCNTERHLQLIRDVFYIMSRHDGPTFYKMQSIGTLYIDSFAKSFPSTPWIFVYRNSVEVMMSHFKQAIVGNNAVCLRSWGKSPHPAFKRTVQDRGYDVIDLTKEEYCASHLASLCEAAIQTQRTHGGGRFVNYHQLPDIVWESILPDHIGITVSDAQLERMKQVAGFYSKGRGPRAHLEWQDDTQRKQDLASHDIQQAARIFLEPAYQQLEILSRSIAQ